MVQRFKEVTSEKFYQVMAELRAQAGNIITGRASSGLKYTNQDFWVRGAVVGKVSILKRPGAPIHIYYLPVG